MGSGIGNMFGIDKIFGGLLDSIGLGALKPLVSMAFDFATGNIPGMLQDLTGLMSSFGDGGFTNNVATNPPLPNAFSSNSQIEDNEYNTETANQNNAINGRGRGEDSTLSSNRLGELFKLLGDLFTSKDPGDMMGKLSQLFKLLSENAGDRETVQQARSNIQFFSAGATITA
jgi:hypothetical protein